MRETSHNGLLQQLGLELHKALINRAPIAPISQRGHELTIGDAYLIQTYMLSHRIKSGLRVIGKKIGATSEPVQKAVGIDQPDFGVLLEDTAYRSGDVIDYSNLIQPRIEGEIAFVLKKDLSGPNVTPEMVIEATDYVSPCLEVVDSRIHNWQINIIDTIADNASCGALILGDARIGIRDLDLAKCKMRILIDGKQVTQGIGAASLGHPANAVAWLANKFGEMGKVLKAGEPILSGSLGALIDVRKGDNINLAVDGIGSCSAKFA